MNIVDFIGFIIAFVAMFFIFLRRRMELRKLRENPDAFKHEPTIEEILKSLEDGEESNDDVNMRQHRPKPKPQQRVMPPPKPKQVAAKAAAYKNHMDEYKPENAAETRRILTASDRQKQSRPADAYDVVQKKRIPRGVAIINKLHTRQDMLIYKELFDKPLAMREGKDPCA